MPIPTMDICSVNNGEHDVVHYFNVDKETGNVSLSKVLAEALSGNYQNGMPYLNRLCQQYKFAAPEYIPCMVFGGYSFYVKIADVKYPAGNVCSSKREAKQFAALSALEQIMNSDVVNKIFHGKSAQVGISSATYDLLPEQLFPMVGHAVTTKLEELNDLFSPALSRAKVTAAFLIHDAVYNRLEVVAAAAGNTCITGDIMAHDGTVLNDCHGEILARRAFLRFLYLHLLNERRPDKLMFLPPEVGTKLELKSRFTIHLYISTTPCGDGRIFTTSSTKDDKNNVVDLKHEPLLDDFRKQAVLRCKIENGHNSIPVVEICKSGIQTTDGINAGDRLITMSCSDKILKWNVLGVQGGLLGTSLYHHGHLSRAVCCRLMDATLDVSDGYRVNHPLLGQCFNGNVQNNDNGKSKSVCLNWNSMEESIVEIIQPPSGKTRVGLKSRLCKLANFQLYKLIKKRIVRESDDDVEKLIYLDAKLANHGYQVTKENFVRILKSKNYGPWVNKPREEKLFR